MNGIHFINQNFFTITIYIILNRPNGESTEKVEELTLEALLEQKQAEKEKARISVSEEAKLTLEKAKAERIEIEESIINAINRIGRTYRNMEVISDELMTVEDGEQEAVVETVEEKVAEILMEEESLDMVELKDVEDSLADINGRLYRIILGERGEKEDKR